MRLELGNIFIKDMQFGNDTKVENGTLYINKEELLQAV
ncbi:MAG: glycine/sarcosine/betaine reductase component B subunit, partial [Clostridium cadaveris]|nr:glycine/sarcosine/betaine reductase component B subunit [Clostridium cadaveris]